MAFNLLDRFRYNRDFFELNLKFLFSVGLWPQKNMTKKQLFLYRSYQCTLHCFSGIFFVLSGIKTYQIRHDLITFLGSIDKIIVAYNYYLKVVFFSMRRGELQKLIDDIFSSGDQVKMKNRNKMINNLVLVTGLNSVLMIIFTLAALYNGEMTIELWMPFDETKNFMNLLLSAQIIALLFCVPFSYRSMAMQSMVCSILIYLCDQLETLEHTLKNFEFSTSNEAESRVNFKKIVTKHIRLMRYSNAIETMFREYFLIQNLAVTVELCLNAMMVTMLKANEKKLLLGFLVYLGCALLYAYIYCKLGNELIDQSESVALAAYSANWTSWPLDIRKDILLIIRAAQTPFKITAGGVSIISMQSYSTALYNGYSIFAVLNDVVEN